MSDEKSVLVTNGTSGDDSKPGVNKAWNRVIAEGYKYRALDDAVSSTTSDESIDVGDPVRNRTKQKWSKPQYRLGIVMVVAVIVIAVLAGVIIWQYTTRKKDTCNTPTCVQTSAFISAKMDLSIDPCEDFYQFTCGNWEKNTMIPASRKKHSIFTQIGDKNEEIIRPLIEGEGDTYKGNKSLSIQKAKRYYNICMDEEKIEKLDSKPMLELISDLGGWAITSGSSATWNNSTWRLMDALVANHKRSGGALFSMQVSVDDKNSSVYRICFQQYGLTLQTREEYFKNNSKYENYKSGFMGFSTKFGELLGGESTTVEEAFKKIYDFEQKLAMIRQSQEELLDPEKKYHKMSVADFQKIIGSFISVKDYLSKMFDKDIPDSTEVLVPTPVYFKKLEAIINSTDRSTLANYVVWNLVNNLVGYMSSKFIDAALILSKEETGVSEVDPRWRRCMSKVNSAFGFVTSTLYVEKQFSDSSRTEVSNIVEEVRKAFVQNMPTVGWMDRVTKQLAIDKADYIVKMIGYPDWINDVTQLDKYYQNITITEGQFFKSYVSILQSVIERNINRLGTVPDRSEWHMKPYETNAYYSPSYNAIVFPAGILQPPFYAPAFPMSFKFGTTGMIVGHEMTHGFDNTGKHYDKFGNLYNWWTNHSAELFSQHSGCMVKQYSSYVAEGMHMRGERTLGENIADNGGLKTAYSAYKHWLQTQGAGTAQDLPGLDYTQEQLFFIGFGQLWCAKYTKEYTKTAILNDPHTYSKYRTIGVVSNSGDFARAFNCKPNSAMNPRTKCQVW
ncbi:hypothetical protein FSP39_001059 [Pinctada imbricata]|uniref:Endothelin-converting enzyme 1 n=1 Tax=Pinctada imbricata TaxID=66713 RepID=A0AA88Y7K3_PINIB|nr:hypothetical protein FSP39_001059 [Pinctada imbricata]